MVASLINNKELSEKLAIKLYIQEQEERLGSAKYMSFNDLPEDMIDPIRVIYLKRIPSIVDIFINDGWRPSK